MRFPSLLHCFALARSSLATLLLTALGACNGGAAVLARGDAGCAGSACAAPDGGRSPDSGSLSDAGLPGSDAGGDAGLRELEPDGGTSPGEAYWTLEPATVDFSVIDRRCSTSVGRPAILHVQAHYFESCLYPGPIRAVVDGDARTIRFDAWVWRSHAAACATVGRAFERDVEVPGLTAGTWHVEDGREGFDLVVAPQSPSACTALVPAREGQTCFGTCDCEGPLTCVAIEGDDACEARCVLPCEREGDGAELGLDCPSSRECVVTTLGPTGPSVGTTCRPRGADLCSAVTPCPDGMRCVADADATSYCEWDIELSVSTRHACTTDADCETPGLECVEHPGGARRCEARCVSHRMVCPGTGHGCNEQGVCEVLDE
jgi:hypothetical protein